MKLKDVTQRALEAYEEHLIDERNEGLSVARFNRIVIEAAREAGFAEDLPDDLLACKPYEVAELTQEILSHVAAAKAPPDPN